MKIAFLLNKPAGNVAVCLLYVVFQILDGIQSAQTVPAIMNMKPVPTVSNAAIVTNTTVPTVPGGINMQTQPQRLVTGN